MLTPRLIVTLCIALLALGIQRLFPKDVWAVAAPARLDPRVLSELEAAASQNRAAVRKFASARQAARQRAKLHIEFREAGDLDSFVALLKQFSDSAAVGLTPALAREGYLIEAEYGRALPPKRLRITATSATGFHHALRRLTGMLQSRPSDLISDLLLPAKRVAVSPSGKITEAVIADFPSFPERGIVEGFYGAPWSHQERIDILRFEGRQGMNVYYYAPKDDPYHRRLWQQPYPAKATKSLGELVRAAQTNFVDFCFAVSPGLSMVYSSDDDFRKLTAKLSSVRKLGVSCFALFLDDVPPELQNPPDKERFKSLAEAHVYVINKLNRQLKTQSPNDRLIVTPTVYTNEWGSRDYIRELGSGVDPDVAIVWTGPRVVSPAITVAQSREWGELLRRPPLIWDNFPVNDGIPWRPNLGPLRGRDPDLPTAVSGFISNPMIQAQASLVPLQTVADYLWNSSAYDPERSLRRALIEQYGKDAPDLLAEFLKTYGDYWWQENLFRPLFVEERRVIDLAEFERRIPLLESALESLRAHEQFQKLAKELSPFLPQTRERLVSARADAAFRHLPDDKMQWRDDYEVLYASRVSLGALDGDFSKWQRYPVYIFDKASQSISGTKFWKSPQQFSVRLGLGWDESNLYVGVDATDPDLYQPYTGRGIDKGDALILTLETAFRKNFESTRAGPDEYRLFFSPGNFAGVKPSVFSDEDYLPPRPQPRDYAREIRTAWKKTPGGFSGDIALPVSYFDTDTFRTGYEIGFGFGAQKVVTARRGSGVEEIGRIIFTSKSDRLFPLRFQNPSSYQRLVLVER